MLLALQAQAHQSVDHNQQELAEVDATLAARQQELAAVMVRLSEIQVAECISADVSAGLRAVDDVLRCDHLMRV